MHHPSLEETHGLKIIFSCTQDLHGPQVQFLVLHRIVFCFYFTYQLHLLYWQNLQFYRQLSKLCRSHIFLSWQRKRNDCCFALVFYHLLLYLFTRLVLSFPPGKLKKRSQGSSEEISVPEERYNDYKHAFYNCSLSFKQLCYIQWSCVLLVSWLPYSQ